MDGMNGMARNTLLHIPPPASNRYSCASNASCGCLALMLSCVCQHTPRIVMMMTHHLGVGHTNTSTYHFDSNIFPSGDVSGCVWASRVEHNKCVVLMGDTHITPLNTSAKAPCPIAAVMRHLLFTTYDNNGLGFFCASDDAIWVGPKIRSNKLQIACQVSCRYCRGMARGYWMFYFGGCLGA